MSDHNTPQAQLQRRDELAASKGGRGDRGRRGRGGRGRGRGGKDQPRTPSFDRTGLPDDEELEREAAELEARQARLAAEADTAQPIDEMPHDDDDDTDVEELSDAELTTPPPEAAPAPMEEVKKPAGKGEKSAPAPRAPRTRSTSKRVPPPQPDVVKTGTVDKHLADDEPVDHEPVRRPRSVRDLDELPDFDED